MYFYFKALHLAFMVSWFAGLFYMFRLYVYHVEAPEQIIRDYLKVMERRLYKFSTLLMVMNLIFGTITTYMYTASFSNFAPHHWLHIKLLLVALLIGYHFYCGKVLKDFKEDKINLTSKQCRIINEVPVLFLFTIVFLASVKPFY